STTLGLPAKPARLGRSASPGLSASRPLAHSETWIIASDGFGADNDGVDERAKLVCVTAGGFRSQPARFACRASQVAIETHATFRNDKWFAGDDPFVKRFVQPRTFVFQKASTKVDSDGPEKPNRTAPMLRIRVDGADDYPPNSALDDIVCAGCSSSTGRARFECNVKDRFRWNWVRQFS